MQLLLPASLQSHFMLSLVTLIIYVLQTRKQASRGEEACPKSHSQGLVELGEKLVCVISNDVFCSRALVSR